MSKKITIIKNTVQWDYLVSSFDGGARAQNHSLQRLDFIVLEMVKLKRSLKNLELDVNVAKKTGSSAFFHCK